MGSASVFKNGMKMEVVDKMRISQVRVATVVDITWPMMTRMALCHEESPLRRPLGWARKVVHQIAATPKYHDRLVEQVCHPLYMHCSYHQVPGGD